MKKRARRVSFAETTAVHFYDREEESDKKVTDTEAAEDDWQRRTESDEIRALLQATGVSAEEEGEDADDENSRGEDVDLSMYKGKVLLVVNVASKCGLTESNYTQLTELHQKNKDKEIKPSKDHAGATFEVPSEEILKETA